MDASRIFALESMADLHAMRSIGCSDRLVYVVPVEGGGFSLSESPNGAITRWSRWGCKSLRPIVPLVELR